MDAHINLNKSALSEWKLQINDASGTRTIPALDKHWAITEPFINYVSLLNSNGSMKSEVLLEEWQHKTEQFREQIQQLLSLRHHIFWSTMVYQPAAINAIKTFLQRSTPIYNFPVANDSHVCYIELYEEVLNLIVRTICRLLTNKETINDWLLPEHHGYLLSEYQLITVPMVCDIIVALGDYEEQNIRILEDIISKLLKIQPKCLEDLHLCLDYFREAFNNIKAQVEIECYGTAIVGAVGGVVMDTVRDTQYDELALYTLDCSYTLSQLLQICKNLLPFCEELHLAESIAGFYDNTLSVLYKCIHAISKNANALNWLQHARLELLKAFRSITKYIVDNAEKSHDFDMSYKIIILLTECLSWHSFVIDYQRFYPVEKDIAVLHRSCKQFKDYSIDYLIECYKKAKEDTNIGGVMKNRINNNVKSKSTKHCDHQDKNEDATSSAVMKSINTQTDTNSTLSPERDVDIEVATVLDVLPDLGTGFIRRLLSRYKKPDEVIAAILDGNLPPDLINADKQEIYIPPDPQDKLYQQTGIRHFNVHDGDKYDVLTQDEPKCIIKKGKGLPGAPKNANELLDDKKDLHNKDMKTRYQQYSLVEENEFITKEYNDEYDDSYEAIIDGQTNIEHASESEKTDDDSSESDNASSRCDTYKNFCENPVAIRARYAERQQHIRGQKNQSSYDVVGAPKGKGQSNETIRNRHKKETNKATKANHNRKAGAAFKRSKGMIS